MAAPLNDIGINPFTSDRRGFLGCVAGAGVSTIVYGDVVIGDASTNARDVRLPTGAGSVGVRGVVSDRGDPNVSNRFAVGDEFACCYDGVVEARLDAGQIATKDAIAICGATVGTVKPLGAEAKPYDIVGRFAQTYDNSAGGAPVLVSLNVNVQRVPA